MFLAVRRPIADKGSQDHAGRTGGGKTEKGVDCVVPAVRLEVLVDMVMALTYAFDEVMTASASLRCSSKQREIHECVRCTSKKN